MNKQFILNYTGTKYKETKELDSVDFSIYDTIIEPFGGSFGFSRYLWEIKGYTDKKYIIYDIDTDLINFYKTIQEKIKDDTIDLLLEDYNNVVEIIKDKCQNTKYNKYEVLDRKEVKKYIEDLDPIIKYMINKNILSSIIPKPTFKKKVCFLDMFKNITFINESFFNIDMSPYKSPNTLIYFDPPYLSEYNDDYSGHHKNKEENIYKSVLDIFNDSYKCIMIHSFGFLINMVFEKYKYYEYTKIYSMRKKKVKHIVYYNI